MHKNFFVSCNKNVFMLMLSHNINFYCRNIGICLDNSDIFVICSQVSENLYQRKELSMKNTFISYQEATGKIDFTFTNDYMFRVILQSNELVLKGLISSLLHLPFDEIKTVEIKNPIKLGETLNSKDFILDIQVLLNNDTLINLEMQVANHHNWTDRSLSYLCRNFDQLYRGQEYEVARPVIHIGILDFVLFPDAPEFYASYKMLNIKSHYVFSDKFTLNVLSLKEIESATEEDVFWKIDKWAKLFAAKTWRDIKMIAQNNEILTSATKSLFEYNADDIIRQQCRAREEAERHERTMQKKLADSAKTIAALEEHVNNLLNDNQKLLNENSELHSDIQNLYAMVQSLQSQ